ncbi:unnamed protein product [Cylicocyclus nassatus]|uniref:Uncharacterized protein n=1 Tax=Cylicocyclus nassatus TaxID=53992 RepID=A0AA36H004_CYLNA|nr:unnamed protein product [Cylicocyclus nassatus]
MRFTAILLCTVIPTLTGEDFAPGPVEHRINKRYDYYSDLCSSGYSYYSSYGVCPCNVNVIVCCCPTQTQGTLHPSGATLQPLVPTMAPVPITMGSTKFNIIGSVIIVLTVFHVSV